MKRVILIAALAVVTIVAVIVSVVGKPTPKRAEAPTRLEAPSHDSTRLQSLSPSGDELRSQFNQDKAYTRLVMLLSPT